jgi:hypothetical protein
MLRGDFGILQKWRKGAIPKTWNVMWANVAQTDGRGENDGGTFMVNVALTVTLYGICVYTVDGEKVCFCREYT